MCGIEATVSRHWENSLIKRANRTQTLIKVVFVCLAVLFLTLTILRTVYTSEIVKVSY